MEFFSSTVLNLYIKKFVCGVYLLAAGRMEIGSCALGAKGK
jgi:hypothetical protein